MPVLTRRSSNQSRSERHKCGREMSVSEPSACDALLEIASSILIARSCDHNPESCDIKQSCPRTVGDCEIFLPISKETLELMKQHIKTLYRQGVPLCIEVKGQGPSTGALLEQWCLQINSRRSGTIPLTFLTRAVSSYLHFSQLRSWIVAGEGRLPFDVLYRVCAPGEDGELFDSSPDIHTFPSAPLLSHHSLDITVKSLPRHSQLPPSLDAPPAHTHCSVISPKTVRTSHSSKKEDIKATNDRTSSANSTCALVSCDPTSTSSNGTRASANGACAALSTSVDELVVKMRTLGSSSHPLSQTVDKKEDVLTSTNGGRLLSTASQSSSPVPWMGGAQSKRRSCALNVKSLVRPRPPVRSNSCPAVPSLCLLGTFEESVLNGRMKPCGHVEGFTAELGASGSFRPAHVSLSVEAAYFSVHSEHGGRGSPYLGHIDLSGLGRKGYRVPKKGTIQLTLFNPNKTVVKIYILTYDLSDMPSLTQTFVRQKTLSKHPSGGIPHLHYLMHLRFHCSKTGHVYLTKNIKLIFAQRAPDTMDFDPSQVNLYTVSEGPTQPKYCPL